jgi:hypothetical protein
MFSNEKNFKLIRAEMLASFSATAPDTSGVYMFFLYGGLRLLTATSYFDTDSRIPPFVCGHTLMYVGAAGTSIHERLMAHFTPDGSRSSLRTTLLAIEHARHAISKSQTPFCRILGPRSLTDWLIANTLVAAIPCSQPFERERELIERYVSPLNINWRMQHVYSRLLMEWREAVATRSVARKFNEPDRIPIAIDGAVLSKVKTDAF